MFLGGSKVTYLSATERLPVNVYEYSPFLNEHRVLEIKAREAAKWVHEIHLCEADRTFSYGVKDTNFHPSAEALPCRVRHHSLKTDGVFRKPDENQIYYDPKVHGRDGFDTWYWRLLCGNAAYHNEAVQRNYATSFLHDVVTDEDIVILSDVDEIVDSRFAERIVEETKRHGIMTMRLHYSVFYLNLFTRTNHGVSDFSYRLFVMTGRYFKTMPFTPDYLRKRGIEGGFLNEIYCPEQHLGFHHSWLEPDKNALRKLQAFRANVKDQSIIDPGYVEKCLRERRLHYLNADLYIDDNKPFLSSLSEMDRSGLWLESETGAHADPFRE
jgi:hypothetical protein